MDSDNFLKELGIQMGLTDLTIGEPTPFGQSYYGNFFNKKQFVILLNGNYESELDRSLFAKQLEQIAMIRHPGLSQMSGSFVFINNQIRPYIKYPFDDLIRLSDVIDKYNFSYTEQAIILAGIAASMGYLEELGVSHYGLNPFCVCLNKENQPIIQCYGIGLIANKSSAYSDEDYKEYKLYSAPETIKSQKSDLYSYAVLSYYILCMGMPEPNFKLPSGRILSFQRMLDELINCDPQFRLPFREIVNRFLTGEILIPGTDMKYFQRYMSTMIKFNNQNPQLKILRSKAYNFDIKAMNELFELTDDMEAIYIAYLASLRNDTTGIINLGLCFEKGRGTTPDIQRATEYYDIANSLGDEEGRYHLGRMIYRTDQEKGLELIHEASINGVAAASIEYAKLTGQRRFLDIAYMQLNKDKIEEELKRYKSPELEVRYCNDLQNNALKLKKLQKFANSGNIYAKYEYSRLTRSENRSESMKFLLAAAYNGVPQAMLDVAEIYYKGLLVDTDESLAFYFLRRLINSNICFQELFDFVKYYRDLGRPFFVFLFGLIHYKGLLVRKNIAEATKTFKRGMQLENADCELFLERIQLEEEKKENPKSDKILQNDLSKEKLIELAKKGSTYSASSCALYYSLGINGFEKNLDFATEYYQQCCKILDADAIFHLGVIFLYKKSREFHEKAQALFEEGSKLGDPRCDVMIASMLRDGVFNYKSSSDAKVVFENYISNCDLAKVYLSMHYYANGVTEYDFHRASILAFESAENCKDGLFYSGVLLYEGVGTAMDKEQAIEIFKKCKNEYITIRQEAVSYNEDENEMQRYFRSHRELEYLLNNNDISV
ncbi:hypothetical protein TVAG_059950 [Trichomonas vaginalis G3]|uniref:Protein kinase domain-containing protein n=1 Tax=Trichomonas vaginalis (strain ATCC PRA-98 / G3) TaxID=412133 RepID=A2FHZ8_TRIV3|nr:cytotoxic cysteine proteinase [Trichomonas vaginalis G3]EAX95471.1 hypothetical protein TVAG_059950 [Trichomonas vaginalis G3]KAI5537647.1 cytotoxic cysteine proteinase [Trichomonas vaginalis G3]|eukprot:XP_001308401.1 hypothetical protein [Trichomonas vaginalis G3]